MQCPLSLVYFFSFFVSFLFLSFCLHFFVAYRLLGEKRQKKGDHSPSALVPCPIYVYMHIYICIIHMCIIYTYTYMHIYAYAHVYIYICMYAYMHICIFVYTYICISYICKCIHICIYVYAYTHMYTHIRIPTGRDHLPSALVRSPFGPRALSSPRLQICHIITECHITSSRALSSPRLQRCHIITECHITSSHSLISHHHNTLMSSSTNTVDITSSYLNICATSHHHMAKETKIAELNTVVLEHKHVFWFQVAVHDLALV